ncbi:hypothetical protein SY27_04390 [Flavobacterium sp. 316]|uniref:hypothetical protein n=1 Tax=Flavobacterium sp. 316 TaxID=1603293 RepID=UPI0005DAE508|nr:hypothetical protein [Flavobacterium sp. 316]KIX21928.1 hypothetical protein SY27_04390 [Flavobacterium sp. 316]
MLQKISKLGTTLNRVEQKAILGGNGPICPIEGNYCPNDAATRPINCIPPIALCCQNNIWVPCYNV